MFTISDAENNGSSPSTSRSKECSSLSKKYVPRVWLKRSSSNDSDNSTASSTEIIFPNDVIDASTVKRPKVKLELDETLKCQLCENLVISPVSTCTSGHLFCAICTEEFENICGVPECKTALSPCPFVENILKKNANFDLECRNSEMGCEVLAKPWEMRKHLKSCKFLFIRCFEKSEQDCNGTLCKLNDYVKHLKEVHKSTDLRFGHGRTSSRSHWHIFLGRNHELHGDEVFRLPSDYFVYDKHEFILHSVRDGQFMFWWITMIGTEAEARSRKYEFKLKFTGYEDIQLPELGWKYPIHSVHNFELHKIKEFGHFASAHVSSLKPFHTQGTWEDGYTYDYIWKIHVEIVKAKT